MLFRSHHCPSAPLFRIANRHTTETLAPRANLASQSPQGGSHKPFPRITAKGFPLHSSALSAIGLISPDAGDRAATLLTLISTALRHDLDVWAYLKAAIDQLQAGSTDNHSLRPDVWKLAHPEFVRTYRTEERLDAATRTRQTRAQRRLPNVKKQSAR